MSPLAFRSVLKWSPLAINGVALSVSFICQQLTPNTLFQPRSGASNGMSRGRDSKVNTGRSYMDFVTSSNNNKNNNNKVRNGGVGGMITNVN